MDHAQAAADANNRLAERYNPGGGLSADEALSRVAWLLKRPEFAGGRTPSGRDMLDALYQAEEARNDLDRDELRLIVGAREQGATWDDVARALNVTGARAAASRYRQLAKTWPVIAGHEPTQGS